MTDWMMPIHPQFRIFMSNLERQMSDEQKSIWVPKAERFEILGCYYQTKLGHGSNVRGIETTAILDEDSDEVILNSPTLSSTKYWLGAAGVCATHGIVVARLFIRGHGYGTHLFLTQLRDLDTHQLCTGVEIYELGPKVFQGMLARNAQVLRDGTYVKPKNTKHSYGLMVSVRALMAEITAWDLLKAVVVAYHYTKFRQQFKKDSTDKNEVAVFDNTSVRYRVLHLLATATAVIVVGHSIKKADDEYTATMLQTGSTSELEDLHLQTVSAKTYSTEVASRGVETCRIACGGHGYSGFGRMYAHGECSDLRRRQLCH
ncbi:uncharacterized protein A1O9_11316 [Exophiala aquamarina CBS 119918]|uniref:Uncharacterized protein n=1 Tax=Exophiala aquamarina CBS 119918 TaxID=1182545 RepID=A0A072NX81_9EURO|nr:uncharacterized protein A1O9_11316 [Exophiala aquamarina CBS 119918]KEF52474.1 hypothetical protein A1O9_11316 [Exophiala aquamarina CBS 119918]